ncbi:hypothetical protein GCM10010525_15670 [Glutamicibacter bergerei]|nr:hypothetical protein [Micrococcaceae bacterium]
MLAGLLLLLLLLVAGCVVAAGWVGVGGVWGSAWKGGTLVLFKRTWFLTWYVVASADRLEWVRAKRIRQHIQKLPCHISG